MWQILSIRFEGAKLLKKREMREKVVMGKADGKKWAEKRTAFALCPLQVTTNRESNGRRICHCSNY